MTAATLLAPVFQKMDKAIHRINHYPLDSTVRFAKTYPLDSDLSGGRSSFEKAGPPDGELDKSRRGEILPVSYRVQLLSELYFYVVVTFKVSSFFS